MRFPSIAGFATGREQRQPLAHFRAYRFSSVLRLSPPSVSVHSNCTFRSRPFIPRQRTSSPEETTCARFFRETEPARFPRRFFARDWNIAQVVSITTGEMTWIKENSIAFTDEHGRRPTFSPAETVKWRMAVTRATTPVARSYLGLTIT